MLRVLEGRSLVESLLEDQQRTAVGKFSDWHEETQQQSHSQRYRDLIPLSLPAAGQQYAFEVDLDACSGCKACVTACHSLNGLDDDETWRSVGLIHGGTNDLPVIQHVTTACHHCLEPACLDGCPVHAYEKDPSTGIVRHLDDQCIGCQYCILKCPYDVPKYNPRLGIVRKCDMCQGRLANGEAPACVQSCPNGAIRISLVNCDQVRDESEANLFLPGAPEPGYTLPATVYQTKRPLPRNLLPADYYSVTKQHAHIPLVVMLVLTQMSVGAIVIDQLLGSIPAIAETDAFAGVRSIQSAAAFLLGLVGLAASVLHLGRPRFAFRAILGIRTSWLSREILAFGIFALLATGYAAIPWLWVGPESTNGLQNILGKSVAISGMAAVFCSTMIYASTRRSYWSAPRTALKFFLTAAVLGLPIVLLLFLIAASWSEQLTIDHVMSKFGAALCVALATSTAMKLVAEASIFLSLAAKQFTPLKRTALLMSGELGPLTLQRFAVGFAGGVLLPAVLAWPYFVQPALGHSPLFVGSAVSFSMVLLLIGESLERYMFFAAVVAPKMPGAPAT